MHALKDPRVNRHLKSISIIFCIALVADFSHPAPGKTDTSEPTPSISTPPQKKICLKWARGIDKFSRFPVGAASGDQLCMGDQEWELGWSKRYGNQKHH